MERTMFRKPVLVMVLMLFGVAVCIASPAAEAEPTVAAGVEMRKERVVLKHEADRCGGRFTSDTGGRQGARSGTRRFTAVLAGSCASVL